MPRNTKAAFSTIRLRSLSVCPISNLISHVWFGNGGISERAPAGMFLIEAYVRGWGRDCFRPNRHPGPRRCTRACSLAQQYSLAMAVRLFIFNGCLCWLCSHVRQDVDESHLSKLCILGRDDGLCGDTVSDCRHGSGRCVPGVLSGDAR